MLSAPGLCCRTLSANFGDAMNMNAPLYFYGQRQPVSVATMGQKPRRDGDSPLDWFEAAGGIATDIYGMSRGFDPNAPQMPAGGGVVVQPRNTIDPMALVGIGVAAVALVGVLIMVAKDDED